MGLVSDVPTVGYPAFPVLNLQISLARDPYLSLSDFPFALPSDALYLARALISLVFDLWEV